MTARRQLVTFLSDFGTSDTFVGVCHGVILTRAPHVWVVDLTHEVPPQDVRTGALLLSRAVEYLPDAVHLAVVDPGVGTSRPGVAVETGRGDLLVGPDNGLLTPAAEALGGAAVIHELTAPAHRIEPTSRTFHGRDVFSPAAAALANGVPISELGDARPALAPLDLPRPEVEDGAIRAEVVQIDRFGNLQLSADEDDAVRAGIAPGARLALEWAGASVEAPFVDTFGDLSEGGLGVLVDSDGALAVAVRGGSAATRLAARSGAVVRLSMVDVVER